MFFCFFGTALVLIFVTNKYYCEERGKTSAEQRLGLLGLLARQHLVPPLTAPPRHKKVAVHQGAVLQSSGS